MRRSGFLMLIMCTALAAAGCAGGGSAGERTASGNPLEQTVLSSENSREARPLTTETQAEETGGPGHAWAINPDAVSYTHLFFAFRAVTPKSFTSCRISLTVSSRGISLFQGQGIGEQETGCMPPLTWRLAWRPAW